MGRVILLLLIALGGFWLGKHPSKAKSAQELEFPLTENKSFVIVVHAHNQGLWCERTLRSIFEQDYGNYRLIFINDGSIDNTEEKAKQFILENHQDDKVILIRNEKQLGLVACLARAIDQCLDKEIVIPLEGKDWLASPLVLKRLNSIYQNPGLHLSFGQTLDYPSYTLSSKLYPSYYASLFKELLVNGRFPLDSETYLTLLKERSSKHIHLIQEPLVFRGGV